MIAIKEHAVPSLTMQRLQSRAHSSGRMENPHSLNTAQPPDQATEPGWKIRNILAPTDFSACSAEAVGRAAALARLHNATLIILHVIDINPPAALNHCGPAEALVRQLWVTGVSELSMLAESLAQNQTKTQTRIVEGVPSEAIVEQSAGFDLLVIGEPRPKSAWNFFPRHTAQRVIERAECPVLVVHQGMAQAGRKLESKARVAV